MTRSKLIIRSIGLTKMYISHLKLKNFRNHETLELSPSPKLNIIIGDNAEGKTNIVEAIHFLSLARSFRTYQNADLILKGRDFALIEARVEQESMKREIRAILTDSSKKITCEGKPVKKISELSSLINVIVFQPKDVLMFNDSPNVRRNYLDINISKKSPIYLDALMRYEKLLKERNVILKNDEPDMVQLDVITSEIIEVSETIINYRAAYVREINKLLSKIITQLKGEKEKAELIYRPFLLIDKSFKEKAEKAYKRSLNRDIKMKATQIGVHREDITMMLNDKDISTHGSQGENRIVVIALKLCPYFLIEDRDLKPIIVLDDVMSELDKDHQKRLISFVEKLEQVFITAVNTDIKNASIFEVKKHTLIRRNA